MQIQGTELVDTDAPETIGEFVFCPLDTTRALKALSEDAEWGNVIEEENEADEEDVIELQELNKYQDTASSCTLLSPHPPHPGSQLTFDVSCKHVSYRCQKARALVTVCLPRIQCSHIAYNKSLRIMGQM